jgi:hypothetical protein
MDGIVQKQDDEGGLSSSGENSQYIKYRHALQLAAGGHTHTLEVEIPVPVGADDETRAQLLHEAEAGMRQLADQIRRRFSQNVQREQSAQGSVPAPVPTTKPVSQPASIPAPQTTTQPLPSPAVRASETGPERPAPVKKEVVVPPTRQSVGASMPAAPLSSNAGGMLAIGDFVKYVKENFGLSSSQAMALLGVKSLSGLNLRDELRRLQTLVAQGATAAESNAKAGQAETPTARPALSSLSSLPSSVPATTPPRPASDPAEESREHSEPEERISVREERPVYIFDEEVGPDDEEEDPHDELEDLEDLGEESELSPALQRMAEDILKKLRDLRGATTVSPNRIQVLNNVAVSQIGDERLLALIGGVWGVTVPKKLKVDQVEELISWAKTEDEFVNQVDAVLALVEEERYARGSR